MTYLPVLKGMSPQALPRLLLSLAAFSLQPLLAQTPATPVAAPIGTPTAPATTWAIAVRAQRPDAIYHRGELVNFDVKVTDSGVAVADGLVDWSVVKDGLPTDQKGRVKLVDGAAVVSGQLAEPGFIQVKVNYRANEKAAVVPVTGLGGAAIDPTEIQASLPVPDDFDAFWTGMKQQLAQVPVTPVLTTVHSPAKDVEVFDVQAPALGLPISGYMGRPVGAKAKSLPIILTVHGAGVSDSSLGGTASWASKGFLAMDMNAHGLPNGKPKEFYADLKAGAMKDYRYEHRDSRENAYFTGMMLRLVRAIDVLTAQPEWDGKHVIVFGSSQGGYQAIVAAGLDPRVTFFAAGVPAGCDHSGMLANRIAGWPKIAPIDADGRPDMKVLTAFRYLDTMNFATRTKAEGCFLTVGFIDSTCPPTSIYATYNQLRIPKQIYNDIPSGHNFSSEGRQAMSDAVLKYVGKK